MTKNLLRQIPKVDEIIKNRAWQDIIKRYPETVAKDALRRYLDSLREDIKKERVLSIPPLEEIISSTYRLAEEQVSPGLKRVINGTGIIIHTNLGRSLLADCAIEAIKNAASSYTNLEYDLERGTRGDRHNHCLQIIKRLTGAEDALVVNNNAGAVLLVLNTLANGKEVVISRGELIEIGGSFRIPDVMKKSGAILKEVGTTNRTHLRDYEEAVTSSTGLFMKAHTSNYVIKGFTRQLTTEEIVSLGNKYSIPTYFDAGSGLLYPIMGRGAHEEPSIIQELKKGIDIISFSGDKLLGAPQAGIIIGKAAYIEACKSNPLTRALRPDKFTLAGLESTLMLYLDESWARQKIPTMRMIFEDKDRLRRRAWALLRKIKHLKGLSSVAVIPMSSEVGGGSLPDVSIPSFGLALEPEMGIERFEKRLRSLKIPIIGRIEKDRLLLDMRTLQREDEKDLIAGIKEALTG